MNEEDILRLIEHDSWMMGVIGAATRLDLPQWMIGAGFVRNKVWDHLHGFERQRVDTADIDLIYFDPSDVREESEKAYDMKLREWCAENWSTKNQARMHIVGGHSPFSSTAEGLAHWVECATCVAVTVSGGRLELIAPYGIGDLAGLIIRPTPAYRHRTDILLKRVEQKRWLTKWPKLRVDLDAPHR